MILADTSIWVDHFAAGGTRLPELLAENDVLMHPFVRGELAMGNLADRAETLAWLDSLPPARLPTGSEVARLVEERQLYGRGVGFVDATLVASALITPDAALWTRDKRLAAVADELGVGA